MNSSSHNGEPIMAAAQPMVPKSGGLSLSIIIVAQDEERTIAKTLAAVRDIADEIVFVDSGSRDRTVEIAQSFGVRFYHQDWLGYAAQKNLAMDLASGDWILSLDADEVLTPELAAEIQRLMKDGVPGGTAGFRIPRLLFIGDTPVRGGGFYPDAQLRLVRRGKGRFYPRAVHESIKVEGKVARLRHDMLHYAYRNIEQFSQTMDKYARLSARHYFEQEYKPWHTSRFNEMVRPLWTFFYRQTVRGGLLHGPFCWRLNVIYAGYVRRKIRYLRQLAQQGRIAD